MSEAEREQPRKLSEFTFSPIERKRGSENGPALRIEGSEETVNLAEHEFRLLILLILLRKKQGAYASREEIEAFLRGEDDEKEYSLQSDIVSAVVERTNKKLLSIQTPPRFVIISWKGMGYYLADLTHPNLYQGGKEGIAGLLERYAKSPKKKS